MKPLILDATPLIYLTKIGLSTIFEKLNEQKYTTPTVKTEVMDKGKQKGYQDANLIEKLLQSGTFTIKQPTDEAFLRQLLETNALHTADAEVIALAKELDGIAVMDDMAARKTSKIYGVPYVGTPYLLMRGINQGLITRERAVQAIRDMISSGWRCDIETYTRIIDALKDNL